MKKIFGITCCAIISVGTVQCEDENSWRVRMNDVEEIVRNINGKFEEIQHNISTLQRKCSELEEKLKGIEQKLNEAPIQNDWGKIEELISQASKNDGYAEAIKLLSHFIANNENDPHVIDAYKQLGSLYFRIKKYNDAFLAYREVYKKDNGAEALSKMGICRAMLKDVKNARIILNKLKTDYKNDKQAISKLEKMLNGKSTNHASNRK